MPVLLFIVGINFVGVGALIPTMNSNTGINAILR